MPANIGSVEVCFEAVRQRGERGIALMIGAGCSKSAGIPVASEFVDEIRSRFSHRCKEEPMQGDQAQYEWATNLLSPGEFRTLFTEMAGRPKLNVAHICVAELMSLGIVERVLTTNFDWLLMQACALGDSFPLIHDCSARNDIAGWIDEAGTSVFYLHGHYNGSRMLNPGALYGQGPKEADEARRRSECITEIIMGTIRRQALIVCGYSGLSDKVLEALIEADDLQHPVFWIAYDSGAVGSMVKLFKKSKHRDRVWAIAPRALEPPERYGADEFFYELLLACGKAPPGVLNLYSHVTMLAEERVSRPRLDWPAWCGARISGDTGVSGSADQFQDLKMQGGGGRWED